MKLKKTHLTAAVIGTALLMASSAQAAKIKTVDRVDSSTVNLEELNLDHATGQEVAYNRLKRAARDLCGSPFIRAAGSVEQAISNQTCFRESLNEAVETLDNAGIRSIHQNS